MHFKKNYFLVAVILFVVEVCIALFLKDSLIRTVFGDYLVVILLYTLLRAFINVTPLRTAVGVLIFAFVIEFLQLMKLVDLLGLTDNQLARTIIGTSFDLGDLVAYTLGVISVYLLDTSLSR